MNKKNYLAVELSVLTFETDDAVRCSNVGEGVQKDPFAFSDGGSGVNFN